MGTKTGPRTGFLQRRGLVAWLEHATCVGAPPEMFFDEIETARTAAERRDALAKARAMCDVCPVRKECGDQALYEEDGLPAELRFGLRAWMTPKQRHAIDKAGGLQGKDPIAVCRGRGKVPGFADSGHRTHRTATR